MKRAQVFLSAIACAATLSALFVLALAAWSLLIAG